MSILRLYSSRDAKVSHRQAQEIPAPQLMAWKAKSTTQTPSFRINHSRFVFYVIFVRFLSAHVAVVFFNCFSLKFPFEIHETLSYKKFKFREICMFAV